MKIYVATPDDDLDNEEDDDADEGQVVVVKVAIIWKNR